MIGREIRYDTSLRLRADIDFCLQSLRRDRIVWIESRFSYVNSRFVGQGGNAIIHRAPISDDQSLMTPLFFENIRHEILIFRGVGTIDLVISTHNGPRLRLFDRDLITRQVNFTQGAFIYHGVDGHTPVLLVVGHIMLQ